MAEKAGGSARRPTHAFCAIHTAQQLIGSRWVSADQVACGVGGEGNAGEPRAKTVVQVTAQAAALLLDGRDRLSARLLQVGRESAGAQGLREQRHGQAENMLVVAGEGQVSWTESDDQLA